MIATRARHGAALVLTLIVLAALILLGVPFLMSQSISLSGSETFRGRLAAGNGRDSAESLGVGVVAHAMDLRYSNPDRKRSDLMIDIEEQVTGNPTQQVTLREPRRPDLIYIRPDGVAHLQNLVSGHEDSTRTRVALHIEDDAARLDVNDLDARAWHDLLDLVGIIDWDDNDNVNSQDTNTTTPVDDDDSNDIGELAEALAILRFTLDGERITDLDQLRLASAGRSPSYPLGHWQDSDLSGSSFGFRPPLTRHEIALLKPYVTVHPRGQGRQSLLDLGTVIIPGVLDAKVDDVVDQGSVLWREGGGNHRAWRTTRDGNDATDWDTTYGPQGWNPNTGIPADTALFIEAPSPLNLVTATDLAKQVVYGSAPSTPADPNPAGNDFLRWSDLEGMTPIARSGVDNAYVMVDPIAAGRSLPPSDIRSWGLVRITSGASSTDPKDRPVASARRTVVAQALPNGVELTTLWDTQDELEVSRRRHQSSRMVSWPEAINRIQDKTPNEDPSVRSWMVAEYAKNHATAEHSPWPQRNWSRPMAPAVRPAAGVGDDIVLSNDADALTKGEGELAPGVTPGDAEFRPDGLVINGSALAWTVGDDVSSVDAATDDSPVASTGTLSEIGGRHLSLWIKPAGDSSGTSSWTTVTPLLEMRAPPGNCYPQIDGTAGSTDFQNLWRLHYDPANGAVTEGGYLVLTLANPAIEHTADASLANGTALYAPEDVFSITASAPWTLYFNEQSLGSEAFLPSAAGVSPPIDHTPLPLSPAQPYNQVRFYYKVDAFRSDRWYHLQVVVNHDRPGGQAILIDGFAGRDIAKDTSLTAADLIAGDHTTLPNMQLDDPLPTVDLVGNDHALGMRVPEVTLKGSAIHEDLALDATMLFPARGTVLIGDEYLSYTAVEPDKLIGCYRSVRANSNTNSGDSTEWWPVTQAHASGDLVVPGGYRFTSGGQLFIGEAEAAHAIPNGDPNAGGNQWRVWTEMTQLDTDYQAAMVSTPTPPLDGEYLTIGESLDLSTISPSLVVGAAGVPTQFPSGPGLIQVRGESLLDGDTEPDGVWEIEGTGLGVEETSPGTYTFRIETRTLVFRYETFDGSAFTGLTLPDAFNARPPGERRINLFSQNSSQSGLTEPPEIRLISLAVTAPGGGAPDLAEPAFRNQDTGDIRSLNNIQVMDPTTGRIEWISYDLTWIDDVTPSIGYFVNTSGFSRGSRGRERTIFAGDYTGDPADAAAVINPTTVFDAGSRILPVQTAVGSAHWIATGDVVTIAPQPGSPGVPSQMVVRFAATDGYRETAAGAVVAHPSTAASIGYDTKNEWFAFTEQVPYPWDVADVEFLSGLCWTGRDLSAYNPRNNRRTGLMPRLDAIEPNLYVLSDSPYNPAGQTVASGTTIDGVAAGELPGSPVSTINLGMVVDFGGPTTISDTATGVTITADTNVFPRNNGGSPAQETYGLALLDGEVIAYQRISNNEATIIARGLLGSLPAEHELVTTPRNTGAPWITGPAITWLPIGPVGRLTGSLPPDFQDKVPFATGADSDEVHVNRAFADAPAVLIAKADASLDDDQRYEFAIFIHDDQWIPSNPPGERLERAYYTAPWLRGAYGSPVQSADAGDLVIAWWPRHPSGLPVTPTAEHYRCRSYAWAGFPIRYIDTFFPATNAGEVNASGPQVEVDDGAGGTTLEDLFVLEARAMATGSDWTLTPGLVLADSAATDISAAFGSQFDAPVQGAELKVTWRYERLAESLREMVARTGASAEIDSVVLRPLGGTRIIATEITP